jgi:hypothetical protein
VGASQLAANSVDPSHIVSDGVGASEIAAGAVGSSEIADGAVGMAELDTPADNGGSAVQWIELEAGENFHYGNAATFTPTANGRCLVVTTAWVSTADGLNDDEAYLRTAREQEGQSSHDGLEGPYFPRIPDGSHASITASAIWDVTAGQATRFGCSLFVRETDFLGDPLHCRTTWFCQ